jgi:hypothetical protein
MTSRSSMVSTMDVQARNVLAVTLQHFLPEVIRDIRQRNVLLRQVPALNTRSSKVMFSVDVRQSAPLDAVFEVPLSVANATVPLLNERTDGDRQVEWLVSVARRTFDAYESAALRSLYSATGQRLGLRQLLPIDDEPRVIAGIDERLVSGWRSRRQPEIFDGGCGRFLASLLMLTRACNATRSSVAVIGRNRWQQAMDEFSPQQIFYAGPDSSDPSIIFGRTRILPDFNCGDDDAFVVEPNDFAHIVGDLNISIDTALDARAVRLSVITREQLGTRRRHRSGSLIPNPRAAGG